jgi:hypothetical protein
MKKPSILGARGDNDPAGVCGRDNPPDGAMRPRCDRLSGSTPSAAYSPRPVGRAAGCTALHCTASCRLHGLMLRGIDAAPVSRLLSPAGLILAALPRAFLSLVARLSLTSRAAAARRTESDMRGWS